MHIQKSEALSALSFSLEDAEASSPQECNGVWGWYIYLLELFYHTHPEGVLSLTYA